MRHMRHVGILAFVFCPTAMAGGEPAQVKVGDEATVAVVEASTRLLEVHELQADYVGSGTIDILNNGAIVVRTGGESYRDENDELVVTATEVIVLGTKAARQVETPLFAIISLKDVNLDIEWGATDGADGVITATDANGLITQVEFMQNGPVTVDPNGGSSCDADCDNGSCTQSCSGSKACIAYCDTSGDAVCDCIPRPKKKKKRELDVHADLVPWVNPD